jgi:hypothetical protein
MHLDNVNQSGMYVDSNSTWCMLQHYSCRQLITCMVYNSTGKMNVERFQHIQPIIIHKIQNSVIIHCNEILQFN